MTRHHGLGTSQSRRVTVADARIRIQLARAAEESVQSGERDGIVQFVAAGGGGSTFIPMTRTEMLLTIPMPAADDHLSGYDTQNRPGSKSYNNGTPSVTYGYDADFKGALSSVSVSQGSLNYQTSYTHDALGRTSGSTQKTGTDAPYVFAYQYSLSDRLSQIQYPSGRTVNYLPDSAGRVQTVQNAANQLNYAQLSYTAPGDISSMTMGNSIVESHTWNDRPQPVRIQAGSQLRRWDYFPALGS